MHAAPLTSVHKQCSVQVIYLSVFSMNSIFSSPKLSINLEKSKPIINKKNFSVQWELFPRNASIWSWHVINASVSKKAITSLPHHDSEALCMVHTCDVNANASANARKNTCEPGQRKCKHERKEWKVNGFKYLMPFGSHWLRGRENCKNSLFCSVCGNPKHLTIMSFSTSSRVILVKCSR